MVTRSPRCLSLRFLQHSMITQVATSKATTIATAIIAISVVVKISAELAAIADGINATERLYSSLPSLI